MNKAVKILALSTVVAGSLFASPLYISTAAQYKTTSFDENSGIDKADTMGIFVSKVVQKDMKIEGSITHTKYSLVAGDDLASTDVTVIGKFKAGKNMIGSAGVHYANTDIEGYDDAYTLIGGIKTRHTPQITSEVNAYYTITDSNDIVQVSPEITYQLTNSKHKYGAIALKANVDYINNGNDYISGGIGAEHKIGNFTNEGGMWFGEKRLAVENGGFTTDKTGLKYTGGYNFSSHYAFTKNNGLKLGYESYTYDANGEEGSADSISVAYNHKF